MRTIIIEFPRSARLSVEMAKMRVWLDAHRSSPSNFGYNLDPERVTIWVDFRDDREAEAFKQQFAGRERPPVNFKPAGLS